MITRVLNFVPRLIFRKKQMQFPKTNYPLIKGDSEQDVQDNIWTRERCRTSNLMNTARWEFRNFCSSVFASLQATATHSLSLFRLMNFVCGHTAGILHNQRGRAWAGLVWLRMRIGGGLLWTRKSISFTFHKRRGILRLS